MQVSHEFVESLAIGVMHGGRRQTAPFHRNGQSDMNTVRGPRPVVDPEAVDFRNVAQRQGHGFDLQHGRQQPLGDRTIAVRFFEPRECARHLDGRPQVIVRNLTL